MWNTLKSCNVHISGWRREKRSGGVHFGQGQPCSGCRNGSERTMSAPPKIIVLRGKSSDLIFSKFISAVVLFLVRASFEMKLTNRSAVPVYTIAGASTARPLPEWLARKRKRSLKQDPEYSNRIELLQDFEFEEASSCVRVSEDGDWVMSTGEQN